MQKQQKKQIELERFYYPLHAWNRRYFSINQISKVLRVWKLRRAQLKAIIKQKDLPLDDLIEIKKLLRQSDLARERISRAINDLNEYYRLTQQIIEAEITPLPGREG